MSVFVRFVAWMTAGVYFAVAAAGGSSWAAFLSLICGVAAGRHVEPPYEAVLGQMVTIREYGVERHVTAAEAFILYVAKKGLEGDSAAARAAMAVEVARCAGRFPFRQGNEQC